MLDAILAALFGAEAIDERFKAHRYYSSRIALGVGILLLAGLFAYSLAVRDVFRTDYAVVIGAMALSKLGAMAWFRLTD